jgi:predicted MPP superfamily phosphohydrolase
VAAASNAFLIEPRRVVVTRHQLRSVGAKPTDPVMRVVQITDLHLQHMHGHARRIAEAVNNLEPELVLFTGDMIDKRDRVGELHAFLSLLDRRPPKYATLGNWEHWARVDSGQLADVYAASGCRLLVNETALLRYNGREVAITGFDDWTGGQPDVVAALQDVNPISNHLVLAHSPVFREVLTETPARGSGFDPSRYSIACVLSGHTHGGQIALFGWAPIRPAGSGRYVAGWYRDAAPHLYVSRGLGTSLLPVRFGASPEIACFDWQLAGA